MTGLLPELTASTEAPPPRTLVDIVRGTVAAHPEATAVDSSVEAMTYIELLDAAEDLAARLAELGIGPGDRVGVRISSGTLDLYVAIIGTLVAGAAYVPVDADDPDERARAERHHERLNGLAQDDLVLADPGPELMFDDRVYQRGALALHALRIEVGDEAFFEVLRTWVAEHTGGSVDTEMFLDHVERVTDADAREVLRPWLFETALPDLPAP